VCYEAVLRLNQPKSIHVEEMFGFGAVGLLANVVSALLLHKTSRTSVNVRAAYLHVIGDLLGSVGVVVGAVAIYFTGWLFLDAIISILIAMLIVKSSWSVITESVDVLLESVPKDLNIGEVEQALRQINHVCDLHDLHVWSITSGVNALSCHIVVDKYDCSEHLILAINKMLKERFRIEHVTIQLENSKVKAEIKHSTLAETIENRDHRQCAHHH
jgi:cobalt-zinc-cadmium efflux system protein